jgi:hypothetical protein
MPLTVIMMPYFIITYLHSKMADVQYFEVDAKLAPVNVGP